MNLSLESALVPQKTAQLTKKRKKSKNSHPVLCLICEQDIIDDRDDSVLCEGICQTWLHSRCAGLSKQVFAILSKSKDPYMCSFCLLSKYKEEITGLRNQITSLTNELASLKCNSAQMHLSNLHHIARTLQMLR